MEAEAFGALLARTNATLNLSSGVLLMIGWFFIRRGDKRRHRLSMLGAVATSSLFLIFYITRLVITGIHSFAGEGVAKTIYLGILSSHIILAILIVPGVLRLLYLVWKERFQDHRRLARWVHPAWLYVSVTGFVVYVLLYHVYGYI
jgi:putative membrane protein